MDKRRMAWLWLTLAVVIVDRLTKGFFEAYTRQGYRRALVPEFLYLVHSRNPGIAFGLFSDSASTWLTAMLVAGSLLVIGVLAWLLVTGHGGGRLAHAGLALILGGAAGNLTDRVLHGGVTDFFEVLIGSYHWPAFNVADSAITIGAGLVILELLFHSRHHAAVPSGRPVEEASKQQTG
jgi:signal peptidase II